MVATSLRRILVGRGGERLRPRHSCCSPRSKNRSGWTCMELMSHVTQPSSRETIP